MPSELRFEKLFSPFQLGELELKNRIVMPSMSTGLTTDEGYVSEKLLDYFEERARGGAGLIIVGYACVEYPRGNTSPHKISIDDDKFIPGLQLLAGIIKKNGARVAIQLNHAGGFALASETGLQSVGSSPVICRRYGDIPRELTITEIQDMVVRFTKGAERAVKAGFEAIEVHAATNYLINQFLSQATNKRTDAYGGNLKNRSRFLMEIVSSLKEVVGTDYPLWVKVNATEFGLPSGINLEDAKELVKMLQNAGCCAINVSSEGRVYRFSKMNQPAGTDVPLAGAIKKVLKIPVIAMGRMTPDIAERTLQEGKADLVAVGRALLADPELPNKVASGRLDDIVPCLSCSVCSGVPPQRCTVNANFGREREYRIKPTGKPKNIVVVGGGPAGMEAARVAALRGHNVTLYTEKTQLGGRLRMASKIPGHVRYADLTSYLANQVRKAGVKVELGKKVTVDLIDTIRPDAVIVATGSRLSWLGWLTAGLISILGWRQIRDTGGRRSLRRTGGEKRDNMGVHTVFLMAAQPNQALVRGLGGKVPEVYHAGDCTDPFGIMQAIADGAHFGRIV